MRILHLSGDVPDPVRPAKTHAIRNLLDLVPDAVHLMYSINRRFGWTGTEFVSFAANDRAVTYKALPFGVFHVSRLDALARAVAADVQDRKLDVDLVHAHKLTIEGIAADRIARQLCVPLIVSSQGNTDLKILRNRPDLRPSCRKVWREAACVLPFAPWTADALTGLLGPRDGPVTCLPCPTLADRDDTADHHPAHRPHGVPSGRIMAN